MTDLPSTIGQADLAALLGISTGRVRVLVRDGVIPTAAGRARYPLPEAVAAFTAWQRDHPPGSAPGVGRAGAAGSPGRALDAEKVRLTAAQADVAEMKAAAARGELVELGAVRATWIEAMADLRGALLAIPSRITAAAGLDRATAARLDAEMRRALAAIADGEPEARG